MNNTDRINQGIDKTNKSIRATALVVKGNQILMIHRFRDGNEYYVLPGGGIEKNETPESATLRELKEETSITATIDKKIADFHDENGRNHQIFLCNYLTGEPKLYPDSPERIHESKNNTYEPMWVEISSLSDLVIWPSGTKKILVEHLN